MGCDRYYAVEYRKSTRNPLCPVLNSACLEHMSYKRSSPCFDNIVADSFSMMHVAHFVLNNLKRVKDS